MTGWSISGMRILLIAMDAGIDMTEEVIKFLAGMPRLMYAANPEPEMVEKPFRTLVRYRYSN